MSLKIIIKDGRTEYNIPFISLDNRKIGAYEIARLIIDFAKEKNLNSFSLKFIKLGDAMLMEKELQTMNNVFKTREDRKRLEKTIEQYLYKKSPEQVLALC